MNHFHINNIGLRNKLLAVFILAVFIPITLTNIIYYSVTTENIKVQKMHDLSLALEQMANEFQKNIDDAVGASSILYTDNRLYGLLDQKYETPLEYILAYNSYFRELNKYIPIYPSIQSIHLYTDNNTILYAGGIYHINDEIKSSNWYKDTEENRDLFPVVTRTIGESGAFDTFSVIRELDYHSLDSTRKIIKTDLNLSVIKEVFNNVTFQGDIYLINGNGMIEYTTNPDLNWLENHYNFNSMSRPDDAKILKEEYSIQYLNGWQVIGVISENELLAEIRNSRKFIYYLSIGNLVIPTLMIIYITSNLHIRLSRIVGHMRKVDNESFNMIEGIEYKDEIGELTSEFNRMSNRIEDLINDVYVAGIQRKDLELQQKKAQLSALQSQINPHFLFNVLETIRMRSFMKKEHETAKIIENMAKLLRTSYTWNKDWVTVEDEVKLIQSFLEIQYYRFGDKMQYEINVDESANNCMIPNMMLIPFVENASNHGIEPLKGQGSINIRIYREADQLVCIIKDNGVGMIKEKYEHLLRSIKEEESIGDNVGIKNVHYRLRHYFHEQFDFVIESLVGKGTTIQISIPYEK